MCNLVNQDETVGGMGTSQKVKRWSIKALPDYTKREACAECHRVAARYPRMEDGSSRGDIEREADWIEVTVTVILDKHVIQIRVTVCSKGWSTAEVEAKRKEYGQTRRLHQ